MMRSTSGGVSGANFVGGAGSSLRMPAMTSLVVEPSKATAPVIIS
jgi:hypothetical protein